MRNIFVALIVLTGLASTGFAQNTKEVVKATKTIRGKFIGFEMGDYIHAIVKDSKGKETSFFVGGTGLDYYLAANRNKQGTFTYQIVSAFIPEANERMDIERMSSAKIGSQSSVAWWTFIRKKMSLTAISKKYEPMIVKATIRG